MNIVIGSGPAGVACALALLRRGERVLMIDGGEKLEPHRRDLVSHMRGTPPQEWTPSDIAAIKDGMQGDPSGVPKKLVYGSDFPFRNKHPTDKVVQGSGVDILSSYAVGGLSNVWGANMLPFMQRDIDTWPITLSDLEAGYRAVAEFVPISCGHDALEQYLPLYHSSHYQLPQSSLPKSQQAKRLLSRMAKKSNHLASHGIVFGQSRVAARSQPGLHYEGGDADDGCIACGLCLYGCPYELIYSSHHTLSLLKRYEYFSYHSGWIVTSMRESTSQSYVTVSKPKGDGNEEIAASRVYLAGGAVSSAHILLRSYPELQELTLLDSQYFLTPALIAGDYAQITQEKLHTLSQVALEIFDASLSTKSIHALIYTYNEMYLDALKKACGGILGYIPWLAKRLVGNLVVMQGYLHSDDSHAIRISLENAHKDGGRLLKLDKIENSRTSSLCRATVTKMVKNTFSTGLLPLPFMTHLGEAGKSYHAGGITPMRSNPGPFETSTEGRLGCSRGIHLVDASCFPSIPATNLTYSVMANAYRIGSLS